MLFLKNKLFTKNSLNLKLIIFGFLFIFSLFVFILHSRINAYNQDQNQLIVSNFSNDLPSSELDVNRIRLHMFNIDVRNGLAFVEHIDDEITVFDISNPKNPRVKSIIVIPKLAHFVADDNSLYTFSHLSDKQTTLRIFDVKNPENPNEIQAYNLTEKGYSRDAFILDNTLFVVQTNDTDDSGELFYVSLRKISLTNPITEYDIYTKGGLSDTGNYELIKMDIFCFENTAFFAVENNGLVHLNLTDNSIIEESLNSTLSPIEISIYENNLFVADNDFGLRIFDYKSYSNLIQIGSFTEDNGFGSFSISNDYLFASFTKGGIKGLDISDPINPIEISEIEYDLEYKFLAYDYYPKYTKGVFIQGDFLIIGEEFNDLLIYDISNPHQPIEVKLNNRLVYWSFFFVFVIIGVFIGVDSFIIKKNKTKIEQSLIQQPMEIDTEVTKLPTEIIEVKEYNPNRVKFLRLSFIIFLAQNISALVFFSLNFFIPQIQELAQPYYFISIPLILDIVVGLMIIISMILLYIERKKIILLICAVMWLIWVGFALYYRIFAGIPGFAKLDQIIWGNNLDINYPYGDTFWISFFFILNLIAFWFATYYTDKAINIIHQKYKIKKFTMFGTSNLVIGILTAITLLLFSDIDNLMALFWGIIFLMLVIVKVILIPIIGGIVTYIEQRSINKDLLPRKNL